MITGSQMRAARALLGIDQKALAELAGLSVPTIQRMEASDGTVRGISNATGWAGSTASKAPTGKISDYVFMLIGAIVVIFILLALLS